jgi:soluble lytic murein transglycosylase-like protein
VISQKSPSQALAPSQAAGGESAVSQIPRRLEVSLNPMRFMSFGLVALLVIACNGGGDGHSPNLIGDPTASPAPLVDSAPSQPHSLDQESPRWNETPVLAEDAAGLADQIATAERAVRDPAVTGPQLSWMGHLQQLAYRHLVEQPQLREAVLAALPEDIFPAAKANLKAGVEHRALVSPTAKLPPWKIIGPLPPDELLDHYRAAEAEFGVPWYYLAAIHLSETFMGRIRGASVTGAQGPMQFMPATWAAYGEGDVNDNRDAIRAAARYLRASGAPGNMANAVYRYNPSAHYVQAVTAYAEVMRTDPAAFRGYYHWQVYYLTTSGDILLPLGYGE